MCGATNCLLTAVFMPATRWCCLASADILKSGLCVPALLKVHNHMNLIICTFPSFGAHCMPAVCIFEASPLDCSHKTFCNVILYFQSFVDCGVQTMLTVL